MVIAESSLFVGETGYSSRVVDFGQASALSRERLEILRLLSGRPMYPAEIARELKLAEQTVYYHMRALAAAGLVELSGYEQHQGGTAKKYSFPAESLSVLFSSRQSKTSRVLRQPKIPAFLSEFVRNGVFLGHFVVGSPDPHGPYRSRGSEFCAAELAMYLGGFCSFHYPLFYLDTELSGDARRENIVAIGGPKVNTLVHELNLHLPVKFDKGSFALHSELSGKRYTEDVGVVEVVQNPFNSKSRVLVLAGNSHNGTRVAVLGLLKYAREFEKGNFHDPKVMAKVLSGFDEDADGIVDTVEILE